MVTVVQVSTTAPSPVLRAGQTTSFALTLSSPAAIDTTQGAPTLALSNGEIASYDPTQSDAQMLAFSYAVRWGDDTFDLAVANVSLNGSVVTSIADGSALDLSTFDQVGGRDTQLRIDTTPPSSPQITSTGGLTNQSSLTVTGLGLAGDQIELVDNAITPIATATVGSDGRWEAAVELPPGSHSVTAAETDAFGSRSIASDPVVYTVDPAAAPVSFTDIASGTSGFVETSAYSGPVSYLEHEYIWTGGSVAIASQVPNAFVHGGSGDDALQVVGGSNVLDGGPGSNFLVGAPGTDGGIDTFFTDARGGQVTWSTIINFHAGDYATLWGFDPNVTTWHWEGISGAPGFTGATLRADVHGTGVTDASMTFAGLSVEQVQALEVTSGSIGGNGFLLFHNPGV